MHQQIAHGRERIGTDADGQLLEISTRLLVARGIITAGSGPLHPFKSVQSYLRSILEASPKPFVVESLTNQNAISVRRDIQDPGAAQAGGRLGEPILV
jgi:hypothetical protein